MPGVLKSQPNGPITYAMDGRRIPNARALELPDGSHLSMYDDQKRYFEGVIKFLGEVDQDRFK